jgi:hypothetical protein
MRREEFFRIIIMEGEGDGNQQAAAIGSEAYRESEPALSKWANYLRYHVPSWDQDEEADASNLWHFRTGAPCASKRKLRTVCRSRGRYRFDETRLIDQIRVPSPSVPRVQEGDFFTHMVRSYVSLSLCGRHKIVIRLYLIGPNGDRGEGLIFFGSYGIIDCPAFVRTTAVFPQYYLSVTN